ncbi:MAG TPA: helix-turn-helix transcriptional regulator [Solirubrobacteraceae bacterium]|nr:helix-turn-helix transcriptional regulator [Solirubrobacteraceae bacterium]
MPPERKSQPRNPELAALGKAIGDRIAEQTGMSQTSVASASGIDIRRVGDYVRGQHSPSYRNLKRLCHALDLSVDDLFDRADKLREEDSES